VKVLSYATCVARVCDDIPLVEVLVVTANIPVEVGKYVGPSRVSVVNKPHRVSGATVVWTTIDNSICRGNDGSTYGRHEINSATLPPRAIEVMLPANPRVSIVVLDNSQRSERVIVIESH